MAGIYTTTHHVQSSNLQAAGWGILNGKEIMEIEFLSGSCYMYDNVPSWLYNMLMNADSKGKFFHYQIKLGGFPYTKLRTSSGHLLVDPPQKQPDPWAEE